MLKITLVMVYVRKLLPKTCV